MRREVGARAALRTSPVPSRERRRVERRGSVLVVRTADVDVLEQERRSDHRLAALFEDDHLPACGDEVLLQLLRREALEREATHRLLLAILVAKRHPRLERLPSTDPARLGEL